ncbi:hypothetical protein RM549_09535 [Salegentibacter sp. F188]|uniref:Uncharacterized protein n=1 Tax=Autumnicola patrickiae TaxID=3075591 RepID=A0ABU3E269_9FLAO|nr:hypothetical protein [Salegentibacter sp. F188]MDT0690025.1 hypothetical protein [Salegentibacter sp. F188]
MEHFKAESFKENGDFVDFFILVAGGWGKSSKRISYRPHFKEFLIIHEIDESYQELNSDEIGAETNLLEAISKKAFYKIDW